MASVWSVWSVVHFYSPSLPSHPNRLARDGEGSWYLKASLMLTSFEGLSVWPMMCSACVRAHVHVRACVACVECVEKLCRGDRVERILRDLPGAERCTGRGPDPADPSASSVSATSK